MFPAPAGDTPLSGFPAAAAALRGRYARSSDRRARGSVAHGQVRCIDGDLIAMEMACAPPTPGTPTGGHGGIVTDAGRLARWPGTRERPGRRRCLLLSTSAREVAQSTGRRLQPRLRCRLTGREPRAGPSGTAGQGRGRAAGRAAQLATLPASPSRVRGATPGTIRPAHEVHLPRYGGSTSWSPVSGGWRRWAGERDRAGAEAVRWASRSEVCRPRSL